MKAELKVKTLSGLKAAEAELAKQERRKNLDSSFLPEGHPLKEVAEKEAQAAEETGMDLPPGHPLLETLTAAKARYKEGQEILAQRDEQVKTRRARRVDKKRTEQAKRDKEEEENQEKRDAVKAVNSAMNDAMAAVGRVSEVLEKHKDVLSRNPYTGMMAGRIERIVTASVRGLSDMRMNSVRSLHDG